MEHFDKETQALLEENDNMVVRKVSKKAKEEKMAKILAGLEKIRAKHEEIYFAKQK